MSRVQKKDNEMDWLKLFLLWLWVVSYLCSSLMVLNKFYSLKKYKKSWIEKKLYKKQCKIKKNIKTIFISILSQSEYDIVQAIDVCLCVKS